MGRKEEKEEGGGARGGRRRKRKEEGGGRREGKERGTVSITTWISVCEVVTSADSARFVCFSSMSVRR